MINNQVLTQEACCHAYIKVRRYLYTYIYKLNVKKQNINWR